MSKLRIPLSEPCLQGNEKKYLLECVETNFVSSVGPFVRRFEEEFAVFVGSPHAVACSSGTAALHVALRVAGVGPGDDVLVSDFTFIATINPIVYLGARPVLVDADLETWNMDPQLVIDELERRARAGLTMPKAVLVAHVLGLPANLEPIAEVCEQHGVTLIEDAAEALGAAYTEGRFAGRQVGSIGGLGCFSFNGNKIMTTGGGGMIVTEDEELARRARHLTTQARVPGIEYVHDEIGYNYRLTNIQAAVGVAQLEQLPGFLERKKEISARYSKKLGGLTGIGLPPRPPWSAPSNWLYTILIDGEGASCDARGLIRELAKANIEARPVWVPAHMMTIYDGAARLGGATGESLYSEGVSLPSNVSLDVKGQETVVAALAENLVGRLG